MASSRDIAHTVIAIIGDVTAFGLFVSPLPTFVNIRRNGSIGHNSPIPYLMALLNCAIWLLYAWLQPNALLVIIINSVGVAVLLVYVAVFYYYSAEATRREIGLILAAEVVAVGVAAALVFSLAHPQMPIGILAVISTVAMYGGPLASVRTVIQTNSVESMPLALLIASFVNTGVWSAYAFLPFDIYLAIPNLLGFVLAALQLFLYAYYCNREGEPGVTV